MPTVPTDALTTRTKVKSYLGITDSGSDTVIDELITYITQYIKNYCGGRNFLSQGYDEQYDSIHGRRKIFLKQRPVSAVTTVYYRSGTPASPVWVAYDSNSYLPYLGAGYIHFYGMLPQVALGIRVVYTAGYLIDFANEFSATHTLPADLTLVATELVAKQLNLRKAQGIAQETTEGQSITYSEKAKELDDTHKNILDTYKMHRIAK